jgi:hypothetical protein
MILRNLKNKKNGFAVLETLLYVSFFAILSILVINSMLTMMKSFKETKIQSDFASGGFILEKITRTVRDANSIGSISSESITLNTEDENGNSATVGFSKSGNDIQFLYNGSLVGNLNSDNLIISSINFTQVSTAKSMAVKIFIEVQSPYDASARTVDFYDTVVLRGIY